MTQTRPKQIQPQDQHSLSVPLFEVLHSIGFVEYENPRHFELGTLFWSLTRLFGFYERIISAVENESYQREFLEADIESFIIRFRIVLNDIAFVVRQLLPDNARGLKSPKGGVHPRNREMRIGDLQYFLDDNTDNYPELASAFAGAKEWMDRLQRRREDVIHYKAKVVVFEGPTLEFALLNAAGTEPQIETPDGGKRLITESVSDYVNSQMVELHRFMHEELAHAIDAHADRFGLKQVPIGKDHRMTCLGIETFRRQNGQLL